MSVPSIWKDVEYNANQQREKAEATARSGPVGIGALYPELYKPWIPSFSNNIGSHLIADVLTSSCVLVDLYNWPDPSKLVEIYGVNLQFLLELREKEYVILCANQLPDMYSQTPWLHSILADERTIFRSIRTPQYFVSRFKDFEDGCDELKKRILGHLNQRSSTDIENLAKLADPSHPLKGAENVADVLSYWGKRLAVINPDTEPIVAQLESRPEDVIREIRQRSLIEVSPITGGLGGYIRKDVKKLREDFPDQLDLSGIPEKARKSITSLNKYIAKLMIGIEDAKLTSEEYWNQLSSTDLEHIFKTLNNREERSEARKAEEWMRNTLLRAGNEGWSEQQIDEYVNDQIKHWDKLVEYKKFGIAAASMAAIIAVEPTALAIIAVVGFGEKILGNRLSRPFVEKLLPKLQFVRFVKKHSAKPN